MIYIKSKIIIY